MVWFGKILTSDAVTSEKYWRITSRVTTNIIINGIPYIILFLTWFSGAETQINPWKLPSIDRRSNFVVLWRHGNTYLNVILTDCYRGSCASFRRRQIDYHSLIIKYHSWRFHWLVWTKLRNIILQLTSFLTSEHCTKWGKFRSVSPEIIYLWQRNLQYVDPSWLQKACWHNASYKYVLIAVRAISVLFTSSRVFSSRGTQQFVFVYFIASVPDSREYIMLVSVKLRTYSVYMSSKLLNKYLGVAIQSYGHWVSLWLFNPSNAGSMLISDPNLVITVPADSPNKSPFRQNSPDSKVHGANMGPIWGR